MSRLNTERTSEYVVSAVVSVLLCVEDIEESHIPGFGSLEKWISTSDDKKTIATPTAVYIPLDSP
jgi:hypothetical protein